MTDDREEIKDTITLAKASSFTHSLSPFVHFNSNSYPWQPEDVDKLELEFTDREWSKLIKDCRYFYKRDPFVSTVLNKIVDISMNDLIIRPGTARDSSVAIIEAIKHKILNFFRTVALEMLVTGMAIPEITFERLNVSELRDLGIARYKTLSLPTDMWVRDSGNIIIKDPIYGSRFSYFAKIPEELKYFILNKGEYQDGKKDPALYRHIVENFSDLVRAVRNKEEEVLLIDPIVLRLRDTTETPYPIPYLYSALESLKHKRNLRRMDYSIASRVITAIMLVKLGNDNYPLTEDNEDQLSDLKREMKWRETANSKDLERIFQLFGNHTLEVSWVFPDTKALLDDTKYKNVNQDIAVALGFPRILVTGETEKSFTSDPEIATISPVLTMERIQEIMHPLLTKIIQILADENDIGGYPEVKFKKINMLAASEYMKGIIELYMSGNLSRDDFTAIFGYDLLKQLNKRSIEKDIFEKLGLEEFAPVPHSNQPKADQGDNDA